MPATKQDAVLIQAAKTGNIIHVQALLAKNVNANAKDSEGTTALMFAAQKGYTEIVRILLNNDANVNHVSRRFGLTALMLAAVPPFSYSRTRTPSSRAITPSTV